MYFKYTKIRIYCFILKHFRCVNVSLNFQSSRHSNYTELMLQSRPPLWWSLWGRCGILSSHDPLLWRGFPAGRRSGCSTRCSTRACPSPASTLSLLQRGTLVGGCSQCTGPPASKHRSRGPICCCRFFPPWSGGKPGADTLHSLPPLHTLWACRFEAFPPPSARRPCVRVSPPSSVITGLFSDILRR